MNDTAATRYRFIVNEIAERQRKFDDLMYEGQKLKERIEQLTSWREEMKAAICSHCNGAGQVNEWRDQDDCKTVTCSYCKGSGLKV